MAAVPVAAGAAPWLAGAAAGATNLVGQMVGSFANSKKHPIDAAAVGSSASDAVNVTYRQQMADHAEAQRQQSQFGFQRQAQAAGFAHDSAMEGERFLSESYQAEQRQSAERAMAANQLLHGTLLGEANNDAAFQRLKYEIGHREPNLSSELVQVFRAAIDAAYHPSKFFGTFPSWMPNFSHQWANPFANFHVPHYHLPEWSNPGSHRFGPYQ